MLSPEFGALRPWSSTCHTKFGALIAAGKGPSIRELEKLWDVSAPIFLSLGKSLPHLGVGDCLVVLTAASGLCCGPLLAGPHFGERWRALRTRCARDGVLKKPYARMVFSIVGMHAGEPDDYTDWLLDPKCRTLELGDLYCFVRRDDSQHLREQIARCVRGELTRADDCLYPQNPLSTINAVLAYIRACMRDPHHFSNQAQVLMLLTWLEEVAGRLRRWRADASLRSELERTFKNLERVERVQALEKGRFWTVVESTGEARVKRRRLDLWRLDVRG